MKLFFEQIFLKFLRGKIFKLFIFPLLSYCSNPFVRNLSERRYPDYVNKLKHGSLVFKSTSQLYTYLLFGEWHHVGVYDATINKVIEFTPEGFECTGPYAFFDSATRISIKICNTFDKEYIRKLIVNLHSLKYKNYAISNLEKNSPSIYCSSFIYLADTEKRIKCSTKDFLGLGFEYITPQGIYNANNLTEIYKMI